MASPILSLTGFPPPRCRAAISGLAIINLTGWLICRSHILWGLLPDATGWTAGLGPTGQGPVFPLPVLPFRPYLGQGLPAGPLGRRVFFCPKHRRNGFPARRFGLHGACPGKLGRCRFVTARTQDKDWPRRLRSTGGKNVWFWPCRAAACRSPRK